jgi:hypothetical protein
MEPGSWQTHGSHPDPAPLTQLPAPQSWPYVTVREALWSSWEEVGLGSGLGLSTSCFLCHFAQALSPTEPVSPPERWV